MTPRRMLSHCVWRTARIGSLFILAAGVACASSAPTADDAQTPGHSAVPEHITPPPVSPTPAPDDAWMVDYAAMLRADELARKAASEARWLDAAAHLERGADHAQRVPSPTGHALNIEAAHAAIRGHDLERAERNLDLGVERGFIDVGQMKSHIDFVPLRERDGFAERVRQTQANATAHRDAHARIDDVQLEFSDIERFWAAYDLAQTMPSFAAQTKVFRNVYLAPATPGLLDYHRLKTRSIEALVNQIRSFPDYYRGIRETTLKAKEFAPRIRAGLERLQALYPAATFPNVTFVIGRLNSGGTAGIAGMLIGVDIWSWTPGIPLDGFSEGMKALLASSRLSVLPFVVLHEHVHALQSFAKEETLLEAALAEGSADFIAGLALPDAEKAYNYKWGLAHEARVRTRFVQQMNQNDTSAWIANMSTATEDWSGDLGYFIGARICEAYYAQAADKQQAIEDILFIADAPAFLEKSGYLTHPLTSP